MAPINQFYVSSKTEPQNQSWRICADSGRHLPNQSKQARLTGADPTDER
jgi:hypothetical protein